MVTFFKACLVLDFFSIRYSLLADLLLPLMD
jgi:hypothetical protein